VSLVNILFVATALLMAWMLWLIVHSNRKTWQRALSIVAAVACLGASFAAMTDLLARPKPVALEWLKRSAEDAKIVGTLIREPESIYVWLQIDGDPEPRAYVIPWTEQNAVELHKAKQKAEREGTDVRMRKPFDRRVSSVKSQFYAPPQPSLPPKQISAETPQIFNGTDDSDD